MLGIERSLWQICFANRFTLVSGDEVVWCSVWVSPNFACIILKSVNNCIVTPLTVLLLYVCDDDAAVYYLGV